MQQSVLYANANIAMQAAKYLLTREDIRNMVSANSYEETLRVLPECGYDIDYKTDDEIIDAERKKTLKTFITLSCDDNLTYCVTKMFRKEKFRTEIAKAKPNLSSQEIDTLGEIAFFKDIAPAVQKIKNQDIKKYFTALADLTNLKTFAKYKLIKKLQNGVFVAGGKIGTNTWTNYFNAEGSALRGLLNGTPYMEIFPALESAAELRKLDLLEDAIGEYLDKIAAANKDNIFLPNLLFWWLMEKQKEFIAVKTILMGKKFEFPPSVIRDNLRGLYERFK
jgi:vacuolar-type H+-ATPase subunit C/Vma6